MEWTESWSRRWLCVVAWFKPYREGEKFRLLKQSLSMRSLPTGKASASRSETSHQRRADQTPPPAQDQWVPEPCRPSPSADKPMMNRMLGNVAKDLPPVAASKRFRLQRLPQDLLEQLSDRLSTTCAISQTALFISKTHRFHPLVTSFIGRLKRLQMPYYPQYVELSRVVTQDASR